VQFSTREAMDFDDWSSVTARMGKLEVAFGLRTMLSYLVFPGLDTHPDMLIFDHRATSRSLHSTTKRLPNIPDEGCRVDASGSDGR
jgi:hypothetical protein